MELQAESLNKLKHETKGKRISKVILLGTRGLTSRRPSERILKKSLREYQEKFQVGSIDNFQKGLLGFREHSVSSCMFMPHTCTHAKWSLSEEAPI